jgi:hypothetical protein
MLISFLLMLLAEKVMSADSRPLARRSEDDQYCWPRNYGRGIGTVPNSCADDEDKNGALCYPKCREGYHGIGPVCWERCRDGYTDDGVTCRRDSISKDIAKAAVSVGDAVKDAANKIADTSKNLVDEIENSTKETGRKIKHFFRMRRGLDIYSPQSYGRTAGKPMSCGANMEADAGSLP